MRVGVGARYLHAGVYERVADGEQRRHRAVGGGAVQARGVRGARGLRGVCAVPHARHAAEPLAHREPLHCQLHLVVT